MLHELRWRKPPRDHRRLWTALAIALVLHVLFVAVVWYEMKPTPMPPQVVQVQLDQGIQVRFIARARRPPKLRHRQSRRHHCRRRHASRYRRTP